jgi:hypothetical protein
LSEGDEIAFATPLAALPATLTPVSTTVAATETVVETAVPATDTTVHPLAVNAKAMMRLLFFMWRMGRL